MVRKSLEALVGVELFYSLIPPHAFGDIRWVDEEGALVYYVREPPLSEEEKSLLEKLKKLVIDRLEVSLATVREAGEAEDYVKRTATKLFEELGLKLTSHQRRKLLYYLIRDTVGLGKIEALMKDPNLEDISCDGVKVPIYVYHRKYGSMRTNVKFETLEELNDFVVRLAQLCHRHISMAEPLLDGALPDGSRLQCSYGTDVTMHGPTFTIRKFREVPLTPIDLLNNRTLDSKIMAYLWYIVEQRFSVLVSGGTATGKTTLLNVLSLFIRPEDKIVSIEDTPELNLPHENWVPSVARTGYGPPDITGRRYGEVSMFDLLKASLRERPDYIVVGEVRGSEAYVLFQGMASVSGDTPVLIRDESGCVRMVRIGDFIDAFYEGDEERTPKPVRGYEVLSEDNGKLDFCPIQYVLRHRADEVYEVEVSGGGVVRATASHSMFTLNPETLDVELKPTEDLRPGDLVVTFSGSSLERSPQAIDLWDIASSRLSEKHYKPSIALRQNKTTPRFIELDERLAYVFGAYLANGCTTKDGITFSFGSGEVEIANRVAQYIKNLFGEEPYVENRDTYLMLKYNNRVLRELFGQLLGHSLRDKRVPPQIWTSPKPVVRAFLEGYKVDARKTLRRGYTSHGSANGGLVAQICWLARLVGYYSFLTRGGKYRSVGVYLDAPRKCVQVHGVPTAALRRLKELLRPRNEPHELTYISKGKFVSERVARKYISWVLANRSEEVSEEAEHVLRNIERFLRGDVKAAVVKSVRKIPHNSYVYDISVPGSEQFFGGDVPISLHNTGHAGLATMHAESIEALIDRLLTPPINLSPALLEALNAIVFLIHTVTPDGKPARRVNRVVEISGIGPGGEVKTVDVFRYIPAKDEFEFTGKSHLLTKLMKERGEEVMWLEQSEVWKEVKERQRLLELLQKVGTKDIVDFSKHVAEYYKNTKGYLRHLEERVRSEAHHEGD